MVDINRRSFDFSVKIIKLLNSFPNTLAHKTVANQLVRSGTSVGANIEEAIGGYTRADFLHGINIAKKEARESRYWLKLLIESNLLDSTELRELIKDSEELVAILTTIIKNSKSKERQNN